MTVTIQFDYSKDTSGFFNDSSRRAILTAAATAITGSMTDHLTPITPSSTNTWKATFNDPTTNTSTTVNNLTVPADTIIVYVGATDLSASSSTEAKTIGLASVASTTASGTYAFKRAIQARGQIGALDSPPTDYALTVASLSFNTNNSYFFNTNPAGLGSTQTDFLSVAEHELVHILGFGMAPSFVNQVSSLQFTGDKASTLYGASVPLTADGQHFASGTNVSGLAPLMEPTIPLGTRKTVTPLDTDVLDDIGWNFDAPTPPTISVVATDSNAAEPSDNGAYTIIRDGAALTSALPVNFEVTGTATRGVDYILQLNGHTLSTDTVTIPAGSDSVDIVLKVINDHTFEPKETAIIGATPDASYLVGALGTVAITDDDAPISASLIDGSTKGLPSNFGATGLDLSADGRYGTFISHSTNLVSSPLTTYYQVYLRDFVAGTTTLVSVAAGGGSEADGDAFSAKISADGRYIAYESAATNIISGVDANGVSDVYVRDMQTNQTWLVSRNTAGAVGGELVAISKDGEQVLFQSTTDGGAFVKGLADANNDEDLFVWSRRTGKYQCVSTNSTGKKTGNRPTLSGSRGGVASFSGDGKFVVFGSRASDLVSDITDGNTFLYDVFVRDLATKKTEYVSISSDDDSKGANNTSGDGELTTDGRYVIFRSSATNLVAGVSDNNDSQDIFVRDRSTGTTRLLSRKRTGNGTSDGDSGVPDIAADGRFAVFTSTGTNIVGADSSSISDAYIFDLVNDKIHLITVNTLGTTGGDAPTTEVTINDDSTQVVFATYADNLPGNLDKLDADFTAIYSHDLITGRNSVLSFDRDQTPASADASGIVLSSDGARVGFSSDSSAIVKTDTNNASDLFSSIIPGHEHARIDDNGKLIVTGSPIDDVINVQRINSSIVVQRGDERFEFKSSLVNAIDVLTGDGDDVVTLGITLPGTYVSAGSGDDVVHGGGGDDRVQGGPGRDTINGGGGNDRIDGGKGNDVISGDAGNDNLSGGDGDDHLYGGGGKDRLTGDIGADTLDGGSSNDRFYAADGFADMIFGGSGRDTSVNSDSVDLLDSIEA